METDPLSIDRLVLDKKIILGSFPTWSITTPDPEKAESEKDKRYVRKTNGDLKFYYGSSKNVFWSWYSVFVDNSVQPADLNAIKHSLERNGIGITNIIVRASRKDRSSFDYDLTNREYNYGFFKYPKPDETLKILCTSKTVMNEMLLKSAFWKLYPELEVDPSLSAALQAEIYNGLHHKHEAITQSVCVVLKGQSGERIECASIPSPGSPYRGLSFFGKTKTMGSNEFLRQFLGNVFSWFRN